MKSRVHRARMELASYLSGGKRGRQATAALELRAASRAA